ncbi:unnamed protein product [Cuscuta epithymum]|uniref:Uncharacterized protein n=1 Tax=Cuscuta epithymum TaxID=186058 RepID=A0AAV0CWV5_9ASTE|nr:unnamed protein product [Cuscuta epithymum]CAH9142269.1 unnamed protein product [Cuscuta epithymum]
MDGCALVGFVVGALSDIIAFIFLIQARNAIPDVATDCEKKDYNWMAGMGFLVVAFVYTNLIGIVSAARKEPRNFTKTYVGVYFGLSCLIHGAGVYFIVKSQSKVCLCVKCKAYLVYAMILCMVHVGVCIVALLITL